jgi:cell division protein FtsI (penicillin-binding protein 3)
MNQRTGQRMSRSINYSASPLLASKTPVWRSKFIVAGLAVAFAGLAGRAAYVQVIGNDFFQRQGEVRFARTLELPANRGRILDRNGLLLASSVVAQSIWAIPEDVNDADPKLRDLAKLLEMPLAELKKRLAHEDKTFVWVKRQVDEPVAKQIAALAIKGIYQRREYKRQYPEGEAAAHVVGFTNVEDRGQEGIELAFNQQLAGKAGSRRVIKDRLGRVVEDVRDVVPPVDGPDLQLSIDSKVQYFAYEKLRDAVKEHKAKAGSVVVIDTQTGEVLALANYPSYNPNKRTGPHQHRRLHHQRRAPARCADGQRGDPEVEQRGHGEDRHADQPARDVGDLCPGRLRAEAAGALPRGGERSLAALQKLAPDRTGHHELRLRSVCVAVSAGTGLHHLCARR